jgi:S-adenosylmethionine:tRNA ribosyltransferase-isomerase
MKTADFDFTLPERLIPLLPPDLRGERRDHARMLVLHRAEERVEHSRFDRLGEYLRSGDVLVVNDTLVVNDQLPGWCWRKRCDFTLVLFGQHPGGWLAAVRPARRARPGLVIDIGCGELEAELVEPAIGDLWLVRFKHFDFFDLDELIMEHGERNLPLYKPMKEHLEAYDNVYGCEAGSLELPSAGLHFTNELLRRLRRMGVRVVRLTLHIGLTEWQRYRDIAEEEVESHQVGAEWYRVKPWAARMINGARRRGGRVVAVGTSTVRALESAAAETRAGTRVRAGEGWTDLYIYPGHRFRVVDAMVTNLHAPRSSHLLLVAAFAGKEFTLEAYREAVRSEYRFDLFGDGMLIL